MKCDVSREHLAQEGRALLSPISETQLLLISTVLLSCGIGIGFILGGLWMEQRLKRRYASQFKQLLEWQEKAYDQIRMSA